MKASRFLGLVALATLTLGSCSNDEVVNDYSQDNAIEFGTYVGRESRVAITDLNELKNDGFGVYANYTVKSTGTLPNFMNNQLVEWDGESTNEETGETTGTDTWTYSPVKYWPNNEDEVVTFWAYSPYKEFSNVTEFTAPIFRIEDGTDYVAAGPVESGKLSVGEKVTFQFGHMMSKVGFKVEAVIDEYQHEDNKNGETDSDTSENDFEEDETTIVVTKVTLSGSLATAGTMTWDATMNDNKGGWDLTPDEAEAKTHTLSALDNQFYDPYDYVYEIADDEESKLNGQAATVAPEQLNAEDAYLMLVPQTADFTIEVEYSVITEDKNLATGYSRVDNKISAEVEGFTFESGNAYNFVLHLGLTSVQFEATVSSWETTEDDRYVNVPLNIVKQD